MLKMVLPVEALCGGNLNHPKKEAQNWGLKSSFFPVLERRFLKKRQIQKS
jgi:hypothetical protein